MKQEEKGLPRKVGNHYKVFNTQNHTRDGHELGKCGSTQSVVCGQTMNQTMNRIRRPVHKQKQFMVCGPASPFERDGSFFKWGLQKTQKTAE